MIMFYDEFLSILLCPRLGLATGTDVFISYQNIIIIIIGMYYNNTET